MTSSIISAMSHEDLKVRIEHRPFVPFRIVLTEGTSYEVRHPELFMLGRRAAVISDFFAPIF
jgi:hypothetical protein